MTFAGGDIKPAIRAGSLEDCLQACSWEPECSALTFVPATAPGGPACSLKSLSGWERQAAPGSLSVFVCPQPFDIARNPPSPPRPPSSRRRPPSKKHGWVAAGTLQLY